MSADQRGESFFSRAWRHTRNYVGPSYPVSSDLTGIPPHRLDTEFTDKLNREKWSEYYFPRENMYDLEREFLHKYKDKPFSPYSVAHQYRDPAWLEKDSSIAFARDVDPHDLGLEASTKHYEKLFRQRPPHQTTGLLNNALLNMLDIPVTPENELLLELARRPVHKFAVPWWLNPNLFPGDSTLNWSLRNIQATIFNLPAQINSFSRDVSKAFEQFLKTQIYPKFDPYCIKLWELIGVHNWEYL